MAGSSPQPTSPYVKVFNCPQCAAAITLRNSPGSISAVCGSCGSIIDVLDKNLRILQAVRDKTKREPLLPLGQRGRLRGVQWEVIGFVERCDADSPFYWEEYLLFNPYHGYRWLTKNNGHWNYVITIKDKPLIDLRYLSVSSDPIEAKLMEKTYQLYFKGRAKVTYVLGEFYWRVKVGDTVEVEDYIAPPEILSCEKDEREQVWSIGEYIEPEEIREAFKITGNFPSKMGIAPNQPSDIAPQLMPILTLWGLFAGILLFVQIFNIVSAQNDIALDKTYSYQAGKANNSIVSEPFELTGGMANLKINLDTMVNNNWLSLNADLVNEKTGEVFPFSQTAEYYYGYSEGEYWQEGSKNKEILLSAIPEGTYHLDMEPSAPGPEDASKYTTPVSDQPFKITVTRKVVNLANFLWAFLFISIFPVFAWFRSHTFEVSRWMESDFSPYQGSDDDE